MSTRIRRRGKRHVQPGYAYARVRNWRKRRLTLHHAQVWRDAFAFVRQWPEAGETADMLVFFWGVSPLPQCLFRRQRAAMQAFVVKEQPQ
jgi:hypothetical protein